MSFRVAPEDALAWLEVRYLVEAEPGDEPADHHGPALLDHDDLLQIPQFLNSVEVRPVREGLVGIFFILLILRLRVMSQPMKRIS